MRFNEFKTILTESRGVTARSPGETYVNVSNPEDVLTFQEVTVIPNNAPAFPTAEEMLDAVDSVIPAGSPRFDDNNSSQGTKAALVARLTDVSGKDRYHVKYIRQVPPQGVHGMWDTIKGYKYGKSAKTENVPIKPSDIIKDENYRKPSKLASDVKAGIQSIVKGTAYEPLIGIMNQAVELAEKGAVQPIKGGAEYSTIVAKYGGEYLGPIAITSGNIRNGDIAKMLQAYNLKSLAGSSIKFPQDISNELVDSFIKTPKGIEIGISTKMAKGGGAASSLSGVVKQLNDEIRQAHPRGSQVIEILGTDDWMGGPLKVAKMYGILNDSDVNAMYSVSRSSTNPSDIPSAKINFLIRGQGVARDTLSRSDYRVIYHAMTAIVNAMVEKVNQDQDFIDAMKAALNNNNFLQLLTDAKVVGSDLTLNYFGKYPAVFEGNPQLRNKTYFATGQKGRIGFTLK